MTVLQPHAHNFWRHPILPLISIALFFSITTSLTGQEQKDGIRALRTAARVLEFSPDGSTLATSVAGKRMIRLWDVKSGKLLKEIQDGFPLEEIDHRIPSREIRDASWISDGKSLIASDEAGIVARWDVHQAKEIARFGSGRFFSNSVATTNDGSLAAASNSSSSTTYVWNVATRDQVDVLITKGFVFDLAFNSTGELLAISTPKKIVLRDVRKATTLGEIPNNGRSMAPLQFIPKSEEICILNQPHGNLEIWSVRDQKLKRTIAVQRCHLFSCSSDGKWIATATDEEFALVDAASGKKRFSVRGAQRNIATIAFSRDDALIATSDSDSVLIRSMATLLANQDDK